MIFTPIMSISLGLGLAALLNTNVLESRVTVPRLNIIKWRDQSGDQKLNLQEEMSVKWKTWGETVGISTARLDGFELQHQHRNMDCMGEVVRAWIQMDSPEVRCVVCPAIARAV